ncbi:unnamed protein product [Parnassius apollo]|uniref:(apollo) hypothetical protein n=1 Tax=Parnassius apollo TaxID=110799 RepID=A0A8S3WCQ2_PARAO|nr:unnamed protein product [Parnassius apollo]
MDEDSLPKASCTANCNLTLLESLYRQLAVRDISSAIANLYNEYILVHQQSAEKFYRIEGFPRVLAAIDCTHIRIQLPCHVIGEEFRNRKGYFSLNVQAICDADLRFMNAEKRYNEAHTKTRSNVIERTFCVWKRRFPVVALTLRLSLPRVQAIIIVTAVLHNICRNHNLEDVPSEVELPTAEIMMKCTISSRC